MIGRIVRWMYPNIEWNLVMPDDIEFGDWEMRFKMSDLLNRATMAMWPSHEQVLFDFGMRFIGAPMMVLLLLFMVWVTLFG